MRERDGAERFCARKGHALWPSCRCIILATKLISASTAGRTIWPWHCAREGFGAAIGLRRPTSIGEGLLLAKPKPEVHFRRTEQLARQLSGRDVYDWLQTIGFYPESYVLPPCFVVTQHRPMGKALVGHTTKAYKPPLTELLCLQFPKSDWTDRTFGIIDPNLHTDMAQIIARNWKALLGVIFHRANRVFSYSFPIPVDGRALGTVGALRAGRMIYEWIEMAERDLAAEAFRYRCLFTTDVKNCYASMYTHSIPWAIHGKKVARTRRFDYDLIGNRLDKLFQNANDGCTNGIPVGPAISDLVAELVLAGADLHFSRALNKTAYANDVLVVRFKDDYRILTKRLDQGRSVLKLLQASLQEYRLELNDGKTESRPLPGGLFRPWVSEYHALNPHPRGRYDYRRFREVYLGVVEIDQEHPGTGVVDRFLADIVTRKNTLRLWLRPRELDQTVSLLLMLPALRAKALPKVLAVVEALLTRYPNARTTQTIGSQLASWYDELVQREPENVYQLAWLAYFMRSNGLDSHFTGEYKLKDPIARAPYTSRFSALGQPSDTKLFQGVKASAKAGSLLQHLDIFDRTP